MPHRIIHLHVAAPAKPAVGAACKGCGVCCASEPCPLGMLVSRRRRGACVALQWRDDEGRGGSLAGRPGGLYRCGLVAEPARFLPRGLRAAAPLLARWAMRSISAGRGCDCSFQIESAA